MGEQKVSDLSYLRQIAMGDEEIVIQTVEAFLIDMPQNVQNINTYFIEKQWKQLAQTAHRIKPNLKYMGIERAYQLVLDIENQVKGHPDSVLTEGKIKELTALCEQAHRELSATVERWRI